jgi:hypothetical protein
MMAERWSDILDEIESAKRHFNSALRIRSEAPADLATNEGYDAAMAFQHAMLAGYTSFENAIKRVLAFIGEELPIGPDWHATLLRRISKPFPDRRPALIGPQLFKAALDLMRFRHVSMHNYDGFEFERTVPTIKSAETFLALVDAEIAAFRAVIDPD